jgi:hypothetical protein
MQVLFGDLGRHYRTYKTEIDAAVQRVLESGCVCVGQGGRAL